MPEIQVLSGRSQGRSGLLLMATLFSVVAWLGRTVVVGETALIWPAIGTSVIWFLVRDARALSVDSLVLACCAFGAILATGSPVELALLGALASVVQASLAAHLIHRLSPELRRRRWALDSPKTFASLVAALTIAVTLGAGAGTLGLLVLGHPVDWLTFGLIMGRNLCASLVVTVLGLVVLRSLREWETPPVVRRDSDPATAARRAELLLAGVVSAGLYSLGFWLDSLPLMFPLLVTTVWVGTRFGVAVNVWHSVVTGSVVVALTLARLGPFADVTDPRVGNLLAQIFVVTLFLTGLALSTGRAEKLALTRELRQREREAVYHSQLFEAMVGSINEGLVVIDASGRILFRNEAARVLLERREKTHLDLTRLLGSETLVVDGREVAPADRPSARALRGESVGDVEVIVRDGGQEWVVAMSASPLPPDEETGAARAVLLFRDATSEHARRLELSTFAGVVAHDLRNPLAAITGWTEMIAEEREAGELDPAVLDQFIVRVRSSSGRMAELITDLLGYATSKDRELVVSQVDLALVVQEVAVARGAQDLVTWGTIPPVDGDPALLRQLVDNLIGNALKYVTEGVQPHVIVTGRDVEPGIVAVSVADNGIGLPAGQHEKVFAEFHRAHRDLFDGHGLGLAICRRIAVRHGGAIVAYDNPTGQGTVFEFRLPSPVAALAREIDQVFGAVDSSVRPV